MFISQAAFSKAVLGAKKEEGEGGKRERGGEGGGEEGERGEGGEVRGRK